MLCRIQSSCVCSRSSREEAQPDLGHVGRLQPGPARRHRYELILLSRRRIEESLASLPIVERVTLSAEPLLSHDMSNSIFWPDGQAKASKQQTADVNYVGQDFFSTLGVPIVAGRGFNERDTESSPKVAVVNRALARKFFPKGDPVGKTFDTEHILIVGIAADAK